MKVRMKSSLASRSGEISSASTSSRSRASRMLCHSSRFDELTVTGREPSLCRGADLVPHQREERRDDERRATAAVAQDSASPASTRCSCPTRSAGRRVPGLPASGPLRSPLSGPTGIGRPHRVAGAAARRGRPRRPSRPLIPLSRPTRRHRCPGVGTSPSTSSAVNDSPAAAPGVLGASWSASPGPQLDSFRWQATPARCTWLPVPRTGTACTIERSRSGTRLAIRAGPAPSFSDH